MGVVDLRRFAAYAKQVMAAGARAPWNEHRNGPERFVTVARDTLEVAGTFIDEIRPDDELSTTERVADLFRTTPWFRQLPEDDQPRSSTT